MNCKKQSNKAINDCINKAIEPENKLNKDICEECHADLNKRYNTKQKKIILDILIQNQNSNLSAQDIIDLLSFRDICVSKATIYRYLDRMNKDGDIKTFYNAEKRKNEYQYINKRCECKTHFHLKCRNCNKYIHLDCDDADKFTAHISKKHDFYIEKGESIVYGLCGECKRKGNETEC